MCSNADSMTHNDTAIHLSLERGKAEPGLVLRILGPQSLGQVFIVFPDQEKRSAEAAIK